MSNDTCTALSNWELFHDLEDLEFSERLKITQNPKIIKF